MDSRLSAKDTFKTVFLQWNWSEGFLCFPQQQMQAYINWVNSQLRKRPGSRYVDDLQNDLRDGVAFLQLIEVVGEFVRKFTPDNTVTQRYAITVVS